MTATQEATIAELQRANAELRRERDAGQAREAVLAEALATRTTELAKRTAELATRNSEYGERIEQQSATIDVLKVMSSTPDDIQPVFDLIVRRAAELCNGSGAGLLEFDGELVHYRSSYGLDPDATRAYAAIYPMPPTRSSIACRAILDKRIIHIRDMDAEPGIIQAARNLGIKSNIALPLMRNETVIGVFVLDADETGGFSDSQIALLKTFAEQAVIAIGSAETYRALQTRTATLAQRNSEYGERIEQQSATIDVLKVMSSSLGNAQPVFELIVERARAFCGADQCTVTLLDGDMLHLKAKAGMSEASGRNYAAQFPRPVNTTSMFGRAILAREAVQTPDVLADPEHFSRTRVGGPDPEFRAIVAVPMLRAGTPIGAIALVRRMPGVYSAIQMELLQTFAEQAVIAITSAETYRALQTRTSDLQESLEYQTATSDVLKVIGGSTFDLQPVFDTIVTTAARLCEAGYANITTRESDGFRVVAGYSNLPDKPFTGIGRSFPVDRNSITGRTVLAQQFVHLMDVTLDPEYVLLESARRTGMRSILGVPLIRDGVVVGTLNLGRVQVRPFTGRQIDLIRTFADQAVIAMENARLITETREALEQQTATAEVLQAINASPGDLAPVFDAMLEKAMRLCGGTIGGIFTFDGDHSMTSALRGVTAALQEYNDKYPMDKILPGTLPARIIETRGPVQNPDVTAGENYRAGHPYARALVELGGIRAVLAVPLLKDGVAVGMVAIYRQEAGAFSDKQIALLQNFAAQAVIAMENARLITEQREALEQRTATAEVLQVINANPGNLAPVFDAVLEKSLRLCEAEIGVLHTYDGDLLRLVATRGVPPALVDYLMEPHRPPPGGNAHRIVRGENIVHLDDVKDSDAYRSGDEARRAHVDLGGGRTAVYVALRKDNTLLGVIVIYRQEVRPFTDKQIALLESFAAQAVIAMENARLITEQREALEQQTATAEVLQVINANPGNLAPVFDAILDKAHTLCGAVIGSLVLFDGTHFRAVATHGFPEQVASLLQHPVPPNSRTQELIDGVRFRQIEDIRAIWINPDYLIMRAFVEYTDVRTVLFVPLRKDGALLGFISAFRPEVRAFSEKEIALLENFAAQAVIAMENARLITEQREALEQQTATAEVLQVINTSPGNLAPVFDEMLQKATDLCAAAFGILWTFDGEHYHAVAFRNVPSAYSEFLRDPPPATPLTPLGRIAAGEAFAQIADMADEIFAAGGPMFHRAVELGGFRTIVGVPLRKDAVLLGAITIYRQEVRPFSDKQIALLQNFAAQAVVAMENARLLNEVRQRQEELRITFENMGDGVAMFDETQHLVAWNRKFQDVLDVPDDIIARRQTFSEYVRYLAERGEYGPEADPEEHVRGLIEQAGQSRTYERTRPNGRVIEIRHNPVPGGGFVLIYADITERKRSEEEIRAARDGAETALRELRTAQANLIQAEKMASLGLLTAGIAHEIKNPLNFVNNFAALSVDLLSELKETAAPGFAALSDKQREEVEEVSVMLTSNLEKITEHGKRADGIVKAMLEHSRGSSGERRTVDLNALIDEALNLAYHGARAQDQSFNITLERDFGAGIAPIEVNPQDMTRVFLNLFANGFYATTRRARECEDAAFVPTLRITTRNASEAVEIRVRDNGTGIPADIRDKLFQPFFTTKPTGEGTGLGLSITYDIVTQQHGGNIAVDSEVGEYGEFTVRLPRKP